MNRRPGSGDHYGVGNNRTGVYGLGFTSGPCRVTGQSSAAQDRRRAAEQHTAISGTPGSRGAVFHMSHPTTRSRVKCSVLQMPGAAGRNLQGVEIVSFCLITSWPVYHFEVTTQEGLEGSEVVHFASSPGCPEGLCYRRAAAPCLRARLGTMPLRSTGGVVNTPRFRGSGANHCG
jgi:hypothetical protein